MNIKRPISAKELLTLQKFADSVISAYLKGKLPPKEVAQRLATQMEIESAREVLDQLVTDGRVERAEADTILEELQSTRSIENSIAAGTSVTAAGGAALTMVSASGTVAGLSASGITSGLAALGGLVGGGMAGGLLVTAGGAFVVGAGIFWWTKQAVRRGRKLIEARRRIS